MVQICRKDKKLVYETIRSGNIGADEISIPNLVDDILLTFTILGICKNTRYICNKIRNFNFVYTHNRTLWFRYAGKIKSWFTKPYALEI